MKLKYLGILIVVMMIAAFIGINKCQAMVTESDAKAAIAAAELNETETAVVQKYLANTTKDFTSADLHTLIDITKTQYENTLNFNFGCHGSAGKGSDVLNSNNSWFTDQYETFVMFDIEFNQPVTSGLFNTEQEVRFPGQAEADRKDALQERYTRLLHNNSGSVGLTVSLNDAVTNQTVAANASVSNDNSSFVTATDITVNLANTDASGKTLNAQEILDLCIKKCLAEYGKNADVKCNQVCSIARCGCRDTDNNGSLETVCEPGQFGVPCLGVASCDVRICDNLELNKPTTGATTIKGQPVNTNENPQMTDNIVPIVSTSCDGPVCIINTNMSGKDVYSYRAWQFNANGGLLNLSNDSPFLSKSASLLNVPLTVGTDMVIFQIQAMNSPETKEIRMNCSCK